MSRLVAGLREVLDYAAQKNVIIAFEPEPGMFIDTMAALEGLFAQIDAPNLRLTLDIGHLQCQGELPIAGCHSPLVAAAWPTCILKTCDAASTSI